MLSDFVLPPRLHGYTVLPTSNPPSPGRTPSGQPEKLFAPTIHQRPPTRLRKAIVAALGAVFLVVVTAPLVRQLHHEGVLPWIPSAAKKADISAPPVIVTTAADGTLKADLFAPIDGSDSHNASVSLRSYLDSHFGSPATSPYHVWITMADAKWAGTGTAALYHFIEQLNEERRLVYGSRPGGVKDTKLVVLCLDAACIDEVKRYKDVHGHYRGGGYAYGGYMHNRPEKLLVSTWPKLAAFTEILPHRDLDPYPHMEPYMNGSFDVVGSENDFGPHINTGWMWLRGTKAVADKWQEVLNRDLETVSRDQVRFNEALDTANRRKTGNGVIRSDFIAPDNVRVHVLDANVFRTHHFDFDRPHAGRDQSVFLHMTCGDDTPTRLYVAKNQGFWSDLDGYYTAPRPMITTDSLTGSRKDVVQMMKVLLTVAYYTHRSVLPPSQVTFLDDLPASHATRNIYSAFPIPHISAGVQVEILEPNYRRRAASELVGRSILGINHHKTRVNASQARADLQFSEEELQQRRERVAELDDVVEFDMRHARSLASFLTFLRSDRFTAARAPTLKLIHFDQAVPADQHWRKWQFSDLLDGVDTCRQLDQLPHCESICRGSREGAFKFRGGWPIM
ncbi:hypothetical protein JCM8202v2_002705 [Rhodotorula sphaerocarpa]